MDDGSPPTSAPVFDGCGDPGCTVLRHAVNRGKGRAIKTGLAHFLERYPGAAGVVTVDADGQHRARDVVAWRSRSSRSRTPWSSARGVSAGTPLRSRIGNLLTRQLFRWVAGRRLSDTQSGLRCFSRALVPRLLALEGERYEYEMNVLPACPTRAPVREVRSRRSTWTATAPRTSTRSWTR